ncbi:hypothetical protein J2X69_002566 [Algoriphagus sp. 4150]|nr:hypothetical protein [Algoriphagus sp. 4150]
MKKEKLKSVLSLGGLKEWIIILLLVALTLFVIYII